MENRNDHRRLDAASHDTPFRSRDVRLASPLDAQDASSAVITPEMTIEAMDQGGVSIGLAAAGARRRAG
jgi:hypothetical protein